MHKQKNPNTFSIWVCYIHSISLYKHHLTCTGSLHLYLINYKWKHLFTPFIKGSKPVNKLKWLYLELRTRFRDDLFSILTNNYCFLILLIHNTIYNYQGCYGDNTNIIVVMNIFAYKTKLNVDSVIIQCYVKQHYGYNHYVLM